MGYPHMYYNGENLKPYPTQCVAVKNVALADLLTGETVLPERTGFSYAVTGFTVVARGGNAATATAVTLATTDDSPALIATIPIALLEQDQGATQGSDNGTADVTLGPSFGIEGTVGKGVSVQETGTDMTGITSLDVCIEYVIIDNPSMSKPDIT